MKILHLLWPVIILVWISCDRQRPFQAKSENPVPEDTTMVVRLHSVNPHYLSFRNKPVILISSGEHYGAVMNAEFDYKLYLETLANEGFNYTRIFIGPYAEMGSDNFRISNNTMDPKPHQWLTPWKKDKKSGKYNLDLWDERFFSRLKSFVEFASQKGIVVEVTLFTSYYINAHWYISPFYFKNNINRVDSIPFDRANTLYNGKIMEYQEKYVRKVVEELNAYDNLFYEIQNEPWSDNPNLTAYKNQSDNERFVFGWQKRVEFANNVSLQWQKRILNIILDEETKLDKTHLVAQNFANFGCPVMEYDTAISVFNFHYADPDASLGNRDKAVAVSLDETGFMPQQYFTYRSQAWKFMLAGGAIYNNLDYSFIVGKEDGSQPIDAQTPGWGGKEFRNQLIILKHFIEAFDFIIMQPQPVYIKHHDYTMQMMCDEGRQYAGYLDDSRIQSVELDVPAGEYMVEWKDPVTGKVLGKKAAKSSFGKINLEVPSFKEDIALRITLQ